MKNLLFIFITLTFTSCEPGYNIYIRNNTSTVLYLKTSPSIESLFTEWTEYKDSVIAHKVNQEGKFSLYNIKPNETFRIWGNIGGGPTLNDLPFDYISLINGRDTTVLDSKEKIIEQVKQMHKKRNYYIEIKK